MPPMAKEKAGSMTPKAIGNRIKAKGLQKLRWYCQMCQKQCRDENGFKCHCMSESHQRQMLVFADNPNKFMDDYSETFEKDFLEMMKHRYNEKRVKANDCYKEFIADRHHQHMNSTTWQTLTDFVIYLGRTGKCKVDQTPKGWFISFINRDPEVIARRAEIEKKEKLEQADEDIAQKTIEYQIKMAKQAEADGSGSQRSEATDLLRNGESEDKVALTMSSKKLVDTKAAKPLKTMSFSSFSGEDSGGQSETKKPEKRKMSAMEEMARQHEQSKEKKARKDYWLAAGIVVKVLNKEVADGLYYKRKGVVRKVQDLYTGVVKMQDDDKKIKIDQDQLETVIPKPGGRVLIVNGAYRDEEAVVKSLDADKFSVCVEIAGGAYRGKVVNVDYEDACKFAVED